MNKKTRKAQVVLTAIDKNRQTFNFLLLQTNERRGQFWQNITGKIDEGETFEEGALREAIEETGLSVDLIIDIIDLNLVHEFTDTHKRNVLERSFLIVLDQKFEIKIDPHEHKDCKWIPINDLNRDVVKFEGNFEALQKSCKILKHWGQE